MYVSPKVTNLGDFREVTLGGGRAPEKDLLGFRALIVIHHPW